MVFDVKLTSKTRKYPVTYVDLVYDLIDGTRFGNMDLPNLRTIPFPLIQHLARPPFEPIHRKIVLYPMVY